MGIQDYREKIISRIIFRLKITDKENIKAMYKIDLDNLMFYYIDSTPKPVTLQECHNQITWLRKYSKKLIKKKYYYSTELNKAQEGCKKLLKQTGAVYKTDFTEKQLDLYNLYITSIEYMKKMVSMFEDMIIRYNSRLDMICALYDKESLPFHSFCQLLNVNIIDAALNIREEYEDKKFYNYLFFGIEDDRQEEGWKDNKSNGMPLFSLVHKSVILLLNRNKEAKRKMDDFLMYDMGLAEHMVTIKEDAEGNKTVEKFYPELKVIK